MNIRTVLYRLALVLMASMFLMIVACDESEEPPTGPNGDTIGNLLPGAAVSVSGVDGLVNGKIPIDRQVTFRIRIQNNTGSRVQGITNGFRLYSPSGAIWTQTTADSTGDILDQDFHSVFVRRFSTDGRGADTIGFAAFVLTGESGMVDGFDDDVLLIHAGPLSASSIGKTLCIDSSWYPEVDWRWSAGGDGAGRPTWSGPHCYQIGQ